MGARHHLGENRPICTGWESGLTLGAPDESQEALVRHVLVKKIRHILTSCRTIMGGVSE